MEPSLLNSQTGNSVYGTDAINNGIQIIDYDYYLKNFDLNYKHEGPYLKVGEIPSGFGWVIYISIIKRQVPLLFDRIVPMLTELNISLLLPESSIVHSTIMDGGLGYFQIGKILSIYPADERIAIDIAKLLIIETKSFQGPTIPTARQLGNCVYTEYVNGNLEANNQNQSIFSHREARWPFKSIATDKAAKLSKWHKGKYFQLFSLKSDVKGNVYKGLNVSKWSNIQWCIIKQGKMHQCADDAGRTIKDRLQWQFEAQSTLQGLVSLPQVIDFFEEDGNSYFIMEYIEGLSLLDVIGKTQSGKIWYDLPVESQAILINLILQAIEIVNDLHTQGYLHRDLSPANFMVNNGNKLVAIDIELCYDFHHKKPRPAFTLGTIGYMSPAQSRMETPVIEDDIFGLGGLLIKAFTGISPTKFNTSDKAQLYDNLMFLIGNQRIASVICACLNEDVNLRPALNSIKHHIEVYHSLILTGINTVNAPNYFTPGSEKLIHLIKKALAGIWVYPIMGKNFKWYSKSNNEDPLIVNEFKSYTWYPGFHTGSCGVLYTVLIADQLGYDLDTNRDIFYSSYEELKQFYDNGINVPDPGLYSGSAGFCVLVAKMVQAGLLENSIKNINLVAHLLSIPNHSFNLKDGIAGQGMAIIQCAELLSFPNLTKNLAEIAERIISKQNHDGSWSIRKDLSNQKGVKHTGLLYGIAGIVYFLLEYGERYYSGAAKISAIKGLNWLLKQRQSQNGHYIWSASPQNKAVDPWLEYGFSGVALVFIKAFELLKAPVYKEAATSALLSHPKLISSNYISQATGLAGLGEIYLEAYKVFQDFDWMERASHIVSVLQHICRLQPTGDLHWLDGSENTPTADFMIGNSGVIHFLLRYNNPAKIKFPLISL